jgi:hypothetical protein
MTSFSIKTRTQFKIVDASGFRPLGPIPRHPLLGFSGAAVEPLDRPAFELPIVDAWRGPSGAEPRGAAGAT